MDLSDGEFLPTCGTFVLCVYGTADTRVAEDVTARGGSEVRSFGSNGGFILHANRTRDDPCLVCC